MAIVLVLSAFMIFAAIVAVEAKGLLSTVISIGAAGLILSVLFVVMAAPDLAITQVVVEVICLVLLIRAAVMREDSTFETRPDRFVVVVGLVGGGILLASTWFALQSLVAFGQPRMAVGGQYLRAAFEDTGAANAVMAVLLDFRAYDTLGEATVIFCAIIGVYAVMRKIGRKSHERNDTDR